MDHLPVHEAWRAHDEARNTKLNVVEASAPILYFGDSERYRRSPIKVITVGLNPSRAEFPSTDPFARFPEAAGCYPEIMAGQRHDEYRRSLDSYFQVPPYSSWFKPSFEALLHGLDCSFYGHHENVALHTDLCSPVATDPTWTGLNDAQRAALMRRGVPLWHRLVDDLAPDLIVASVARAHLAKIEFAPRSPWQVMHTVSGPTRTRPYLVEVRKLALTSGESTTLVFGAAANKPFGTVSNLDKAKIGATLKAWLEGGGAV